MRTGKVISILIGILMTIAGIIFLIRPLASFQSLIFILGIVLIFEAVSNIVAFFNKKGAGHNDIWSLLGAMLSLIAGILLICNNFAKFLTGLTIIYCLAIWIIIKGVLQIAEAFSVRGFSGGMGMGSTAMLIIGLLMVVGGVIGLLNPIFFQSFISTVIAIIFIFSGISLIAGGASMPG